MLWGTGGFGELCKTLCGISSLRTWVCKVEIKLLYGDFKDVGYPTKSRALPSTPIKEITQQTTTNHLK